MKPRISASRQQLEWKSSLPPDIAKTREVIIVDSQSENFDPNQSFASPFYWAAFTSIHKKVIVVFTLAHCYRCAVQFQSPLEFSEW